MHKVYSKQYKNKSIVKFVEIDITSAAIGAPCRSYNFYTTAGWAVLLLALAAFSFGANKTSDFA